jgi:methionine aminopeptidase
MPMRHQTLLPMLCAVTPRKKSPAGAYPAPLNFAGFPKSSCISINDVRAWVADR